MIADTPSDWTATVHMQLLYEGMMATAGWIGHVVIEGTQHVRLLSLGSC